jgi:hypothetical protein
MWGYQLALPWWVLRGIEASPNGLTMAEIAAESLFQNLEWAFLLWGTEATRCLMLFYKGGPVVGEGNKVKDFYYIPLLKNFC